MYDDATLCYWVLWITNCWTFWGIFLSALTFLAFWPIIVTKIEEKADRINSWRVK
jgi:hypothetical protein